MTGLVFVVIALAWIAYLVPSFVARRDVVDGDVVDPVERFGESVRIVAPSDVTPECEVSTPLTRRATRAEIRDTSRRAARRRRRVVYVLGGLLAISGVGVALHAVVWWTPIVPFVLLVAFLVVARISVVQLNARLDAQLAELDTDWREDTVSFEVPASLRAPSMTADGNEDSTEFSIEISAPVAGLTGSLWDPIPVTVPTYVSKPLVPRTVRTIDLSAPALQDPHGPVVAEARGQQGQMNEEQRPWAVGE